MHKVLLDEVGTWGNTLERKDILEIEGCPYLQCLVWKFTVAFVAELKLCKGNFKLVRETWAAVIKVRSKDCCKI